MNSFCTTFLIVPAAEPFGLLGNTGGQCRIATRRHHPSLRPDLVDYRLHPELWTEAGLMNCEGKLVCLEAPTKVFQYMQEDQPLAAPTTYTFDMDWNPA